MGALARFVSWSMAPTIFLRHARVYCPPSLRPRHNSAVFALEAMAAALLNALDHSFILDIEHAAAGLAMHSIPLVAEQPAIRATVLHFLGPQHDLDKTQE